MASERLVSIRDVVEPEELKFAQTYLAFGKRDAAEAYRRSFMRRNSRKEWVECPRGVEIDKAILNDPEHYPTFTAKEISKKATALLRQDHIRMVIAELERNTGELAQQILRDQALFGRSQDRIKASERIFNEQDRLGFKEAVDRWAEILCEVGAEVVVPFGVTRRMAHCRKCGELNEFEVDLAVEVKLDQFFS